MTDYRIITQDEARALLEAATPGPWDVGRCDWQHRVEIPGRGPGRGLASVGTSSAYQPHPAHGNAELMAAAPDLAHTVDHLHGEVERLTAEVERLRRDGATRTVITLNERLAMVSDALDFAGVPTTQPEPGRDPVPLDEVFRAWMLAHECVSLRAAAGVTP